MKSWITGLVAAFLVFGAPGARADQGAPSGVRWEQLSPQEQRVLGPYRDQWNQLPPIGKRR